MAVSYPLSGAAFLDLLPVQDVRFNLTRARQITGLAGGDILTAERAPAYWSGQVSLAPMASRRADDIAARLEGLEAPGRAFEVYHPHRIGPASDPLGTALTGYLPLLEDVDSTSERIKIGGLPSGFQLSSGDLIAFDYDPGTGSRRAFHRLREARQADTDSAFSGKATSLWMTVSPHVRPGFTLGVSLRLVRPALLAVLVPGSVSYGITRGATTSGVGFEFRQKLRA